MTGDFVSMALYAGTGVDHIAGIEPAADRIRKIVAEADSMLAKARSEAIPELSSAVCYVGEVSGDCAGSINPAELERELNTLGSALQSLVAAGLATDSVTFSKTTLAPWMFLLRQKVGNWPRIARTESAECILGRRSQLLPRMPEGSTRQMSLRLRTALEQQLGMTSQLEFS